MPGPVVADKLIASVSNAIAQALAPRAGGAQPQWHAGGDGANAPRGVPPVLAPAPTLTPAVQMLVPMAPWDWPAAVAGTMPYQQFVLADAVPASALAGVPYGPTAASFSGSYYTFLQLLAVGTFALPAALESALALCAPPHGNPADTVAPDGWAASPDSACITRWRPAYGVSITPYEWQQQVANSLDSAVTLPLPIDEEKALTVTAADGTRRALSLQHEATLMEVSAAALAQVTITPGSWFNDSLVHLGRNGAFVAGVAPNPPYAGMLSARVSGLIVAYNPVLRIVGPDPATSVSGPALRSAQSVQVGGFTFPAPAPLPPQGAPVGAAPAYSARSAGSWIVGVTIEAFS